MSIITKERVDVNQDGLSLITEVPPHHWAPKDVNGFTYEKLIIHCFSLLYIHVCLQCDEVFSISGFNVRFPRTPKKWKKYYKKCSSDYFHIVHVVESDSFGVKSILKCLWGLEAYNKMFMSSVDQCIPI